MKAAPARPTLPFGENMAGMLGLYHYFFEELVIDLAPTLGECQCVVQHVSLAQANIRLGSARTQSRRACSTAALSAHHAARGVAALATTSKIVEEAPPRAGDRVGRLLHLHRPTGSRTNEVAMTAPAPAASKSTRRAGCKNGPPVLRWGNEGSSFMQCVQFGCRGSVVPVTRVDPG